MKTYPNVIRGLELNLRILLCQVKDVNNDKDDRRLERLINEHAEAIEKLGGMTVKQRMGEACQHPVAPEGGS